MKYFSKDKRELKLFRGDFAVSSYFLCPFAENARLFCHSFGKIQFLVNFLVVFIILARRELPFFLCSRRLVFQVPPEGVKKIKFYSSKISSFCSIQKKNPPFLQHNLTIFFYVTKQFLLSNCSYTSKRKGVTPRDSIEKCFMKKILVPELQFKME